MVAVRRKIGELLLAGGILTQEDLEKALERQKEEKKRLGEIVVDMGLATEVQIYETLGLQLGVPFVDLQALALDPNVVSLISQELAEKHGVLPIELENGQLQLAMSNTVDVVAIDDVRAVTGLDIRPVLAPESEIRGCIEKYFHIDTAINELVEDMTTEDVVEVLQEEEEEAETAAEDVGAQAPIVKLVNMIMVEAVRSRASDIHIEPQEKAVDVRYRVDGLLADKMQIPKHLQSLVISRIKIISEMDIAERRRPQDGRSRLKMAGRELDLRVSTLPTVHGEKVCIRILDKAKGLIALDKLGFTGDNADIMRKQLDRPQGMILVTGPTGSGKSSTLYAALNEIKDRTKNIVTVEDPVEYQLEGINQVHVNEKAGLTFAAALRSILRQDPNVVLVGEIRDRETAEIAFQASLTGHLVLSTLHTNDAASTLTRLIDLGIEPYLVASSVCAVLAQRLIRILCPSCKVKYEPTDAEKSLYPDRAILERPETEFYRPEGCNNCELGYKGRSSVHEIIIVTPSIRDLIIQGAPDKRIAQEARKEGMKTLREDGLLKVADGLSTFEEVLRLTYSELDVEAKCPHCNAPIEKGFQICPNCHKELRLHSCENCGKELEVFWDICPYCRTERRSRQDSPSGLADPGSEREVEFQREIG